MTIPALIALGFSLWIMADTAAASRRDNKDRATDASLVVCSASCFVCAIYMLVSIWL